MAYRWGDTKSYGVSADVAGKVMDDLAKGDGLTAHNLVEVSRPEEAPLHKCFEWDDAIAAEHFRESQARRMIGAIEIVREEPNQETKVNEVRQIRAFHALREEQDAGYEHIEVILSDEEKSARLMALAKRDMEVFKDKYRTLKKLEKVFAAMDEVMEDAV